MSEFTTESVSRKTTHESLKTPQEDSFENYLNGDGTNAPFLRTSSVGDLFSTVEPTPNNQYEWTKYKSHSNDFHCLSHTTLVSGPEDTGMWPFVFESGLKIADQVYEISKGESNLAYDKDHNKDNERPMQGNFQKKGAILETIKYLGEGTFSTSFVEKIMNSQPESPGGEELLVPTPAATHTPFGSGHTYQINQEEYYWPEASAHPVQLMWQAPNQSSMISFESISSRNEGKTKLGIKPEGGTSRRRTIQLNLECSSCFAHLGISFVRGLNTCSSNPIAHITCQGCLNTNSTSDSTEKLSGSEKKRKRRETKIVDCEVCHSTIGNGGIKSADSDLKVEFVCTGCGEKYMFCSECGGGGKQRTGKWRPKELFEQGRRTCSLPHIRVGSAEIHYKVVPVEELTSEILQGIQDVFFDCMLSLYCIPNVMTGTHYEKFGTIKREIEQLWLTSVLDVLINNALDGRKYVTVAWIHKRHRNKGMGRSNTSRGIVPWLQKLGLSGIIPPPKNKGDEESEDTNHCFVAFSIAEWEPLSKTIFMAQMAPRSVFLKTMEGYHDLIKHCVEFIKKDAKSEILPTPEHIWCWAKADHARLQTIPSRLKFVPKGDYLDSHPNLDPSIFERKGYEPLYGEGIDLYAAAVKNFASK